MKIATLVVRLLLLLFLGYLLLFLAVDYHPEMHAYRPPFVISALDTINLFIHEAGHFFFRPFGMWIYVLAGSLFQILLPLALVIVTWQQKPDQASWPAFWVGENCVNVSVYIKDAPHMQLKLLAKGVIHDWNWLLNDNLEAAEPLGDALLGLGILICVASIGMGIYFAVRSFRDPSEDAYGD
jgi:hypothetical protein